MDWPRTRAIVKSWVRPLYPFRARPPRLPPGVVIGRHTYGYGERTFPIFTEGARIEVGAFCSIHGESRIVAGADHVTTRASTFPFSAYLFDPVGGTLEEGVQWRIQPDREGALAEEPPGTIVQGSAAPQGEHHAGVDQVAQGPGLHLPERRLPATLDIDV